MTNMTNTTTNSTSTSSTPSAIRYIQPDGFTKRILNPLVSGLARLGLSIRGSRVLAIRGRTTGEWRTVPVNPLPLDGDRFLVAPRGTTQWVRNIRAANGGELRKGRTVESFTVTEVADADKTPILRAYLDTWGMEVGKFFEGLTAHSTDDELAVIAAGFPVFRINAPSRSA